MYNVSILICTFNNDWSILDALNSIPKRDDIQIIIVNDGSIDNTDKIILDYIKNNKNVKYIKHKQNYGVGIARNTASKFIEGKYFTFLDADDIFYKDKLNNFINEYLINNNIDIIYYNLERITPNGKHILIELNKDTYKVHVGMTKFFKTKFIKENNITWNNFKRSEDSNFDSQYWDKQFTQLFTNKIIKCYFKPNRRNSNVTILIKDKSIQKEIKNIEFEVIQ